MISADAPSFDTPYDAVYSMEHANKDTETHFDGQGMVLAEGYADYPPHLQLLDPLLTSPSRISAAYLPPGRADAGMSFDRIYGSQHGTA